MFREVQLVRIALIIALWLAAVAGCVAPEVRPGNADRYIVPPHQMGNHRIGVLRAGEGFSCEIDGVVGEAIYRVADVGHPRVPRLRPRDVRQLRAILRYVQPTSLRFTYVGDEFVLFNAPLTESDICGADTPPFAVWNGSCNEYYNPLLGVTEAVMTCGHPPRPWVKNDRGNGNGSWATIVH